MFSSLSIPNRVTPIAKLGLNAAPDCLQRITRMYRLTIFNQEPEARSPYLRSSQTLLATSPRPCSSYFSFQVLSRGMGEINGMLVENMVRSVDCCSQSRVVNPHTHGCVLEGDRASIDSRKTCRDHAIKSYSGIRNVTTRSPALRAPILSYESRILLQF